jgi:hypothetical protein
MLQDRKGTEKNPLAVERIEVVEEVEAVWVENFLCKVEVFV